VFEYSFILNIVFIFSDGFLEPLINKSKWCSGSAHRLSINRPTKRGKQKSPSDGHCQCKKEMDDHLMACQQFLKKCHTVTRLAIEKALFLKINDINDISFFGTLDCHHCCSIA
jgi:hypothetical protein